MLKFSLALFITGLFSLSANALTNSTIAESSEWSPIVLIKSEASDSTGDTTASFCNATFIAKNIMVTAAHCVKLAYISKDNLINIQTGYYKYVTKPSGQVVRIGYVPKSNFNKHVNIELPKTLADKISSRGEKANIGPTEDFAVLWWHNESTPETNDLHPAEFVTPAEHSLIIKRLKDYAFKIVTINLFSEMSLDTKRMGDLDIYKWNNGYVHSKSKVRVEEGDSGAPLYVNINNKLKIFGVVKGKATTVFSNWDVYTSIGQHLCPLNKRMPTDMLLKACQ
jgi:hypothetical protein